MKNIIVIRAGALGDIILTLPALQVLRQRYPDTSLRVVGYPGLWEIAGSLVDEIVSIDAPIFAGLFTGAPSARLCDWLRGVDLVVAWTTRDPRSALEICAIPHVVHASPYPPPGVHASDWLIDSLKGQQNAVRDTVTGPRAACCGRSPRTGPTADAARHGGNGAARHGGTGPTDHMAWHGGSGPTDHMAWHGGSGPTIVIALEEMERGSETLAAAGLQRPIAIHPGAGAPWKRWPAERFAALAQELVRRGHQVVLIEGPADAEVVAHVRNMVGQELPALCEPPLQVLAAILARCALFVGNDSGVAHLAAATGVPTIALFGPTDPTSWAPRGRNPQGVQVLRRCEGRTAQQGQIRVCDDPDCMAGIEVVEVVQAVETALANVQNPVENSRFSVENFVDRPSTSASDSAHHHFDRPSSGDMVGG